MYGVSTSVTDGLSISDCLEDICVNSQPCLNDGMCVQSGTSLGSNIVCLCKLGFIGDNCAQGESLCYYCCNQIAFYIFCFRDIYSYCFFLELFQSILSSNPWSNLRPLHYIPTYKVGYFIWEDTAIC